MHRIGMQDLDRPTNLRVVVREIRAEMNLSRPTHRQRIVNPPIKVVVLKEVVESFQEVRGLFVMGHQGEVKMHKTMGAQTPPIQPRPCMILPRSKLRKK